jgi:hypothetical protein
MTTTETNKRSDEAGIRTVDATIAAYAALGLTAGVLSGMVGIGGGILIVPALVFLFGLSQHQAQGTTLALLVPPIGFLGAWTYYRQGYVDLRLAALIAVGFFLGSLFGARFSVGLSDKMLARVFGSAVVLIGAKMLLGR